MSESTNVVNIGARRSRCCECTMTGYCLTKDLDHPEGDGRYDIPVTPRVMHRGEHLFRPFAGIAPPHLLEIRREHVVRGRLRDRGPML